MKLGFIGCGNMATAIINGIVTNQIVKAEEIIVSDKSGSAAKRVEKYGITAITDNRELVRQSDIIVFAVKPQYIGEVMADIKDLITADKLCISIVAGKTIEWFHEHLTKEIKLVRTMPNTPALVGAGMTGVCANENVTKEDMDEALRILKGFGKAEVVPENLMDVVVSVSGSAPAYVFMFIEAMADAAVADGMPRAQAYEFAAQAVMGSAKLMMETGKHPGELKDMVCSPGGTTIEAVRVLEQKGFRSAVIEAMKSCAEVARNL
ncbi:MAG: pyrroline-5-carboxylate reductase [bacterium]|nr:pyrroline-5-carboxylate reductase [bacterium]